MFYQKQEKESVLLRNIAISVSNLWHRLFKNKSTDSTGKTDFLPYKSRKFVNFPAVHVQKNRLLIPSHFPVLIQDIMSALFWRV